MLRFKISVIVAIDADNGIGKNGTIPWKNTEDLSYFKNLTIGNGRNAVIMGKKTYESIPQHPLKKRQNIVISKTLEKNSDIIIFPSLLECFKSLGKMDNYEDIFVIGGEQIYNEIINDYLYLCEKIYVTKFKESYDCDKKFPISKIENFQSKEEIIENYSRVTYFPNIIHQEYQYLDLLKFVLTEGEKREDRTNTGTLSIFGARMEFDLTKDFPLITTKKINYNSILKELLFFLSGQTDTKLLEEQGVNIWKGNTTQEFIQKRGLTFREGDMGACFPEGTQILTKKGYKNIEDVIVHELVYTHLGKWESVIDTMSRNYTGKLFHITAKYHPLLKVTEEHPFYARKFKIKDRYQNKRNVVIAEKPEWIQAKDLTKKSHFIGMKIETAEETPTFNLKEYINQYAGYREYTYSMESYDEFFMCGLFLGDGWIVEEEYAPRIFFIFNDKQEEDLCKKISRVLNISLRNREEHCAVYRVCNIKYAEILRTFGKKAHGKVIPEWIHRAKKHQIEAFLDGYFTADGCVRETNKAGGGVFERRSTTVSSDIAYSIQRLYLKLEKLSSVKWQERDYHKVIRGDKESFCRSCYFNSVTLNPSRRNNYSFIEGDYAWFAIDKIEYEDVVDKKVFNLSVQSDESYTVMNLLVHNCYGFQWRHWNAEYNGCDENYDDKGIDQIQKLITNIKEDPFSRRHILSSWNVSQLNEMILEPCHILCQFYVSADRQYLDCQLYQRSGDLFLGIPFNISSYCTLLEIVAHLTNLKARKFIHIIGDSHIYVDHIEQVKTQLKRFPLPFPTLQISEELKGIDLINFDNIKLNNYISWPYIQANMAI
jgi:thymidylate synthase